MYCAWDYESNARRISHAMSSKPNRWHPLEPEKFRRGINALGLNMSQLARLIGGQQRRVERWCRGEEDIPHTTRALLALMLADPRNVERLQALSDEYLIREEQQHE
jgi:DNA-binding transcriptional regulator YiaG